MSVCPARDAHYTRDKAELECNLSVPFSQTSSIPCLASLYLPSLGEVFSDKLKTDRRDVQVASRESKETIRFIFP